LFRGGDFSVWLYRTGRRSEQVSLHRPTTRRGECRLAWQEHPRLRCRRRPHPERPSSIHRPRGLAQPTLKWKLDHAAQLPRLRWPLASCRGHTGQRRELLWDDLVRRGLWRRHGLPHRRGSHVRNMCSVTARSFAVRNWEFETEKGAIAAPFRIRNCWTFYFPLAWKRLLTSAQLTTFHHSLR